MKKLFFAAVIPLLIASISGCVCENNRRVTQVSTYEALYKGAFDGSTTLRQVLCYGDTGFGVIENIDGEMIIYDGKAYLGKQDGKVYTPSMDTKIPFATVVKFKADKEVDIANEMGMKEFETYIDKQLSKDNLFAGFVIKGTFKRVKTKSYPPQTKPYKPLKEIIATQPEFDYRNIKGTIVAFKFPPYLGRLQRVGYHFHFLSDDHKSAGHVIDFAISNGKVAIDMCNELLFIAPEKGTTFNSLDFSK
ncbi:MAG: acetolactate decarboxylase [Lentisphaerae bacterium]|nr:acetolactate decarboxylase [Lentisphaerota bacterium]MCP4102275.1 acetolactate decarboxylase [Lentisphaerota bacterium]